MTTLTAIVPARSGSKRLPGKNIKILAGKPLVIWTLEACIKNESVNEVIFSTDSMNYWTLVCEYIKSDKLKLDYRSEDEAGDNVKIFDYLKDGVDKIFGDQKGAFLLALPTMPLRTTKHIKEAFNLFKTSGKAVFSAVEYDFSTSFAFEMNPDNSWNPVFENSPMITGNTRSQDQKKTYHPNGAIYIREINDLRLESLNTIYDNANVYIMDSLESIDIDMENDFKIAELIITNKHQSV